MLALFLCPAASLPQEAYQPHVAEASEEGRAAMATHELPEGFDVELWAAEPMLANPVIFHIDHAGDVYVNETFRLHAGVTDMREHMDWLEDELASVTVEDRVEMYRRHEGDNFASYGTEHERIRLVRDTDGDGFADEAVVFADGFQDPADGIAAGVLSYRGDVFYTCIPSLWLLRDEDGDGVADERKRLSDGYGVHVALLGHDLHGLVVGPDGRLYFSIGDRGFHIEHEGKVLSEPHTGAVFRCELDGSDLEVFHTGLRNPQELVFDDRGDLFTGENNSDGGDKARWVQIVEGADTGWRFFFQYVTEPNLRGPWNDEKLWHPYHEGQPAYVLPPIANLASGPSGLEYYPGTGLPPEYDGHFFLCDFRGDAKHSGIFTYANIEKGASFELGPVEKFVWYTLATDCQFGPDGGFYYSDWVHGWGMTGKGRMYRLRHAEALDSDLVRETEALLKGGFEGLANERLGALLAHADRRVRQEAQLELAQRGAGVDLLAAAHEGEGLARLHGLWGAGIVARRDDAARAELVAQLVSFLDDDEAEVRAQAARVLGDLRATEAADRFVALLGDASARARHHAAIGLGRIGVPSATEALFGLAADVGESDTVLRHAAVMGLVGCASDGQLLERTEDPDRHARMAALLALRRRGHAGIARFLEDADPLLVREAATAIHDERIDDALPALAALIGREGLAGNALVRRVLNANLWLGDGPADAERLAAFALRDDQDEAHRAEALRILAEWDDPSNIDRVLGRWLELPAREAAYVPEIVASISTSVRSAPDRVLRAWVEVAGSTGAGSVSPTLAELARDVAAPTGTRIAALSALEALGAPELRTSVADALAGADGKVRAAGLDVLQRLSPAESLPLLVQVLDRGEVAERRVAYRALGGLDHPDAQSVLAGEVQRLVADLVPAEVQLELILAAEARGDAVIDSILEDFRAPRQRDAELAPWLDGLFGGDPRAGKKIFRERVDVSCLRCHGTGKPDESDAPQIGPALKGVGSRLTRLQLLESVVAPNRRIAAGYETTTFFMNDGEVIEGRVVEEGADALVLVDSDGAVWDIDLAEVDERRPGLSAMPSGLGDSLTRAEMRDVLEYLSSL
ncbi:MAG: PVC-type heme-binding CxxCH protein [Planctomycetota bacterium]